MEDYLSYVESLEDKLPELKCVHSGFKEHECIIVEDSCEECLSKNDNSNFSDDCLYGFDTPEKDKFTYILNLMKKIESETNEETVEERDVIDGIEFLSFATEQELMDYTKKQQDQRANASQSDDGLEILDDGSFSDISSNHAIVPTKTKDITRIKGWRNKHFAGINVCNDSGSTLRNDDDGFGDDFEIKSVQDESSEELESVDSTTSNSGFEADLFLQSSHENNPITNRIDSSVIEDTNEVDNAEGFNLKKSNETLFSASLTSDCSKKYSSRIKIKDSDISFNHFDLNGIFTSDKTLNVPSASDQELSKKDHFISPLTPQDKKFRQSLDNKVVYKPRVKHSLIESIARKISAANDENITEESTISVVASNRFEQGIRWRVPKDKLLSGNIYDVEVSLSSDPKPLECELKSSDREEELEKSLPKLSQDKNLSKFLEFKTLDKLVYEDIAAFQSRTLDHYTTNLDKLHIDFTVPTLDAADNVTHEEIVLPTQDSLKPSEPKSKPKPLDSIKAKTVAEKRRLLTELSKNQQTKRKQKLSFKMLANKELDNNKRVKRLRGRIEKNTFKAKVEGKIKSLGKKSQLTKQWFDEQGVITYGRENPLKSAINKRLLSNQKENVMSSQNNFCRSKTQSDIGMVLNVGLFRPLFKEADDNIKHFALDDKGNITAAYAAFASSAVQTSCNGPFTVNRILVPVVDDTLKKIMYNSKLTRRKTQGRKLNKPRRTSSNKMLPHDLNVHKDAKEIMSDETKQFAKNNKINTDVLNCVSELVNYIEIKEHFQDIVYDYDPDIPKTQEEDAFEFQNSTLIPGTSQKEKKTQLQRQIEKLGCTFINVLTEEYNEENLSKISEENRNCLKECCKMGCVCYCTMLKQEHCGKVACMFSCQCQPFAWRQGRQGCEIKSKIWLLPEVLRHQSVSQSKLAPVEREYHQTVIMSKDNKITIEGKPNKRKRKIPSKYRDEILFDYGKDTVDIDCIEVSDADEQISKPNLQEQISKQNLQEQMQVCFKKPTTSPLISSLKQFLKKSHVRLYSNVSLKLCSVQIECDDTINQMGAALSFTPGVLINNHKCYKSDKMKVNYSRKTISRNVAKKKTGATPSHDFNTESHCARTYGVTMDYKQRNLMCRLFTKDMLLYAAVPHGEGKLSSVIERCQDPSSFKEYLQLEIEHDVECLERFPNEEESGLEIDFVYSLPPDLFERQDFVDQEENTDESNPSSVLSREVLCNKNEVEKSNLSAGKNKRIVYATLPMIENECKWWVVELDSEKFTYLIYYSEKRCLTFQEMSRAVFSAEFNEKPIKLVMKKQCSTYKDKFGAYAVPGHKHLMFFGPYDLSEKHGLTALKYEDEGYVVVPFTTNFSSSDKFESLGIDMSHVKQSSHSVPRAVNAVWWYSTNRNGSLKTVTESREIRSPVGNSSNSCSEINVNSFMSNFENSNNDKNEPDSIDGIHDSHSETNMSRFVSNDDNSNNDENEQDSINGIHEIKSEFDESDNLLEELKDDITIEQDPVKIEPYDDYDTIVNEISVNNTLVKTRSPSTESLGSTNVLHPSIPDMEGNSNEGLDKNTPVKNSSVDNDRSLLRKNIAKVASSVNNKKSPSVNDPIERKKRKRKVVFTRTKKRQKQLSKQDMSIISLKKKIENLNNLKEAINSTKFSGPSSMEPMNFPEIEFESDSSSLSDEDLYEGFVLGEDSNISKNVENVSNIRRVIHKGSKVPVQLREPHKGPLPDNLVLPKPREGPCPDWAFLCLTPGIGYIPVIEFDKLTGKLVIADPINNQLEHMFHDRNQASDWLNKFFQDRIVFKPKFNMQWALMAGKVVRSLQPLNYEIFTYSHKKPVIRPEGLELDSSDRELIQWERQESKFIKTEMERARRYEMANLMNELARLVFSVPNPYKLPKREVLRNAVLMVEAQKIIEEELKTELVALKKKKTSLNNTFKNIISDIVDHEERRKALDLCTFIKCRTFEEPGKDDVYIQKMKEQEIQIITKIARKRPHFLKRFPRLTNSRNSSESSQKSVPEAEPESPVSKQPTEGVLVRKNKNTGGPATSQPDGTLSTATKSNEVIDLVDSDDDNLIIEIESEEEDVIWLPDKCEQPVGDDDVEIIKPKRSRLKFPKPKRKLPQSPQPQSLINTSQEENVSRVNIPQIVHQSPPVENVLECSQSGPTPAPVAMIMSPAVMAQHRLAAQRKKVQSWTPGPEFVAVDEEAYEPVHSEFSKDCSRTKSVPSKVQARPNPTFLPIEASSRVNVSRINTSASTFVGSVKGAPPMLQKTLTTPINSLQQKLIKCKNLTPIGRIGLQNKFCMIGKPILVCKNGKSFQLSKLPQSSQLTHLTTTPVTNTETSRKSNYTEKVSQERANTVTLYHPSQERSETRTVQFAPLNSVQMEVSSVLSGPKIRKPRGETCQSSIKVLLPKRS